MEQTYEKIDTDQKYLEREEKDLHGFSRTALSFRF